MRSGNRTDKCVWVGGVCFGVASAFRAGKGSGLLLVYVDRSTITFITTTSNQIREVGIIQRNYRVSLKRARFEEITGFEVKDVSGDISHALMSREAQQPCGRWPSRIRLAIRDCESSPGLREVQP